MTDQIETTKKTITGGKAGFTEAIEEAFSTNCMNPTIRYSRARGFHVETGHFPADEDVVWEQLAYYSLNCDGKPCLRPSDYKEIREDILNLNN